jgi:hypothetical protein
LINSVFGLGKPATLDTTGQLSLFAKLKLMNCAPIPGLPEVGFFARQVCV